MFEISRRFAFAALIALSASGVRADIVVNTAADEDANNAACSLREAITAVNAQADYNGCTDPGTTWSKVTFAIAPNTGEVHTIALGSALPGITKPVFIDATTQSGTVCTPVPNLRVQINRFTGYDGLVLAAGSDNSTIHGLAISGSGNNGSGLVLMSNHATVGCVISGMDASGATQMQNSDGIFVAGQFATIGEATATAWFPNLIAGNFYANVDVYSGADDALIAGNYIGVDHTGLTALQTGYSINAVAVARLHIGTGFTDGPAARQRNVIGVVGIPSPNPNSFSAVEIFLGGTSDAVIAGNYIGVGADGHTVLPIKSGTGVNVLGSSNTLIGCNGIGSWEDCRNLIAVPSDGNFVAVVVGVGGGSANTAIVSNFINVAADGATSLVGSSNYNYGLEATNDVLVARNVISAGSGVGIFLESATAGGGTAALLNPALAGSGGAPLNSTDNCLPDTISQGITEYLNGGSATPTLFVYNWWGAVNGPAPGGSGASADPAVYTVPFLTAPSPYCGFDHIFTNGFDG